MPFFLILLIMNLFYAGTPTFMKLASHDLNPFQIVYLRHTLALLAFFPFFLMSEKKWLKPADFMCIIIGAFFAFTFASVFQIIGVNLSQAADGSFIMAMEPVVTIIFAFFFLKERLDSKMFGGLSLALMGFVILSSESLNPTAIFKGHGLGNFLFLLAVMGEASFPILLKPLLKRYPPQVVAFYCLLCASLYMLPFQGPKFWQTLPNIQWQTWGSIAYLGLGCSFLSCFLWLCCLKKHTVSRIAASWFLQPLFGCLIAGIVLSEPITSQIWMGGGFIITALALLTQQTLPSREEQPAVPTTQFPVTVLRVQHPLWFAKQLTPLRTTRLAHPRKMRPLPHHRYHSPHHTQHTYH